MTSAPEQPAPGSIAPLRTLFVGGPGRSGTSFVADRLAGLAQVASFPSVELKFFTEKSGLLDLWISLGEHYSPNRAAVAMQQFQRLIQGLVDGQFGQQGLSKLLPREDWLAVFDRFMAQLKTNGHPAPVGAEPFDAAARTLVAALQDLALAQSATPDQATVFLEKTPHALLSMPFLSRLAPGAAFLHVMRDPRSIAQSLKSMPWGPNDLGQCCAWVASYCAAWSDHIAAADITDCDLKCLLIEDVAAMPDRAGADIGDWLALNGAQSVFASADPATLNGWANRYLPEDLALLTERLAVWIDYFGYDRAVIGRRPSGASGVQANDRSAEPTSGPVSGPASGPAPDKPAVSAAVAAPASPEPA